MMILSTKAKPVVVLLSIAIVVAMCALPGSAFAGEPFAIAKFENTVTNEGGAPDTQAASHPYAMTTTIEIANHKGEENHRIPSGSVKDLEVGLPAGMIVNPNATQTKCSEAELDVVFKCPISAVVGVVYPELGFLEYEGAGFPVYNMVAPPGVPAAFGFVISTANIVVHIYGDARTGSDYGLSAKTSGVLGRALIDRVAVKLWGDPTAKSHDKERGVCAEEPLGTLSCEAPRLERPLLTLPSACTGEPLQATVRADSWQEPENYQERTATSPALTGCKELGRFGPTLSVAPTQRAPESPTGLEVNLKVPQAENVNALAEADLKEATVTLPAGMGVSPSAANGLAVCPLLRGREQEQEEREARGEAVGINLESQQRANCPDASKLGTVKIVTPLLETPLEGSVYVAQQGSPTGNGANPFGSLFALYLVAEGDGVVVKLPGEVSLDPSTGRVSARFGKDPTTGFYLPQLPFSELKMDFFGGQRAPLVTPASCGTYTTHSVLTPYGSEAVPLLEAMNAAAEPGSGFTLTEGCGARGFAPAFTAGVSSIQAGSSGEETVTIARNDGEQNLGGVTVTTPPGLLGLVSKVPLCEEPQAGEGSCSEESKIGETTVAVGPGDDPYWVAGGKVYLTGPYENEPFGLSIVVPTVAGPFTLEGNGGFGKEVVRASIAVNPLTGALTIASTLPTIVGGVPLDVRTINVDVNREGFVLDPTSCEELHVTSSIVSTEGATATPSSRIQAANCAALPFKPGFSASTQAKTSKADGASLKVKLEPPAEGPQSVIGGANGSSASAEPGEANIKSVKVELPKQLPSRLATLQKACTAQQFDANPAGCPSASMVGTAIARTPVLKNPLTGPAYFVSHGAEAFPQLIIVLQGENGLLVDLVGDTHISKAGITSSTFASVPDVPVSSFEFTLPQGPYSALAANAPLCAQPLSMPTEFTGQNGAVLRQDTPIEVAGCPNTISVSGEKIQKQAVTVSVYVPAAGRVKLSATGLGSSSKAAKGRETLTFKVNQKKAGKLATKLKILFTPTRGRHQLKTLNLRFRQ